METTNIVDFTRRDKMTDALTELLRTGAQDLIAQAVEAEFSGYMAQFSEMRTEAGHAAVVRNGHHPERPFQTGIGPVSVRIPKVRSKDGTPVTFRSVLVPPYVRRTKTLEAALPWLYLKGISSGEMASALKVMLGPDATGLSANTISRLKRDWAAEYDSWKSATFDDEPIVYIWADGVHSGLRGEDHKLCALVIVGVSDRPGGSIADGRSLREDFLHALVRREWLALKDADGGPEAQSSRIDGIGWFVLYDLIEHFPELVAGRADHVERLARHIHEFG